MKKQSYILIVGTGLTEMCSYVPKADHWFVFKNIYSIDLLKWILSFDQTVIAVGRVIMEILYQNDLNII